MIGTPKGEGKANGGKDIAHTDRSMHVGKCGRGRERALPARHCGEQAVCAALCDTHGEDATLRDREAW